MAGVSDAVSVQSFDRKKLCAIIVFASCCLFFAVIIIVGIVEITNLKSDLGHLQTEYSSAKKSIGAIDIKPLPNPQSTGNIFVRWGRTSCGANSRKVYKGFAGGGRYIYNGSAVNTLCLPEDPELKENTLRESVAQIYGTEYENKNKKSYDMPCAVCDTRDRNVVFMLPAKRSCPVNWTVEYKGMLMAGYHGHNSGTEYICVDEDPEADEASGTNSNGKLMYFVGARCGSLPCSNYPSGKLLTCAVCSR